MDFANLDTENQVLLVTAILAFVAERVVTFRQKESPGTFRSAPQPACSRRVPAQKLGAAENQWPG